MFLPFVWSLATDANVLAQARPFPDWGWLARNTTLLRDQTWEHVELTFLAVAIGLAIAGPLAVLATRRRALYTPLLTAAGMLFTIPSLALFVLLVAFAGTGLGRTTSLIGLVIYSLLVLYRNTAAGLDAVPDEVMDTAAAMGYTARQRLWRVELPLAVPLIVAGVRIATVTTIGLVTVTALIGQGGLGRIMLVQGFQRQNRTAMAAALLGSVALAALADLVLVGLQRRLTPWSRSRRGAL